MIGLRRRVYELVEANGSMTSRALLIALREEDPEFPNRKLAGALRSMVKAGFLETEYIGTPVHTLYRYRIGPGPGKERAWRREDLPVVLTTADGRFIRRYDSIREASEDRGESIIAIYSVCMRNLDGKWPYRWYTWRFAGDHKCTRGLKPSLEDRA